MNEIAEAAMLPSPSLTKLVDRMVQDNLVYRRSDVADRRRVMLFPTDRGNAVYALARAAVDADEAELTARAGAATLAGLRAALGAVAGVLRYRPPSTAAPARGTRGPAGRCRGRRPPERRDQRSRRSLRRCSLPTERSSVSGSTTSHAHA